MEGGGPFDDSLFSDFAGPLPGTNTLLCKTSATQDNRNVHSIQVMLGLQQMESVAEQNHHSHHDITVMFQHPNMQQQHEPHKRKDEQQQIQEAIVQQGGK